MQQVGDDAFFGTGTDVGWLVVRDGRDLTLVDTGPVTSGLSCSPTPTSTTPAG